MTFVGCVGLAARHTHSESTVFYGRAFELHSVMRSENHVNLDSATKVTIGWSFLGHVNSHSHLLDQFTQVGASCTAFRDVKAWDDNNVFIVEQK